MKSILFVLSILSLVSMTHAWGLVLSTYLDPNGGDHQLPSSRLTLHTATCLSPTISNAVAMQFCLNTRAVDFQNQYFGIDPSFNGSVRFVLGGMANLYPNSQDCTGSMTIFNYYIRLTVCGALNILTNSTSIFNSTYSSAQYRWDPRLNPGPTDTIIARWANPTCQGEK